MHSVHGKTGFRIIIMPPSLKMATAVLHLLPVYHKERATSDKLGKGINQNFLRIHYTTHGHLFLAHLKKK
jgi:hypothetical protein